MFYSIYIIFIFLISTYHCRLPDKIVCANEECTGPISTAKTLMQYHSIDKEFISFPQNAEAVILMKSAGTNPDIWYATINGRKGFVNSKFLRELKIIEKNPNVVLPIDAVVKKPEVQPDKVKQSHEVFEGTTIFTHLPVENPSTHENIEKIDEEHIDIPISSNKDKENPSNNFLESNDASSLKSIGTPLDQELQEIITDKTAFKDQNVNNEVPMEIFNNSEILSDIEVNSIIPQSDNLDAQTSNQDILGYETELNQPISSSTENISVEAYKKKEHENVDFIEQNISSAESTEINNQNTLSPPTIDDNLNKPEFLADEPKIFVQAPEILQTHLNHHNENDKSNLAETDNFLNINGVHVHDDAQTNDMVHVKKDSEETPAETLPLHFHEEQFIPQPSDVDSKDFKSDMLSNQNPFTKQQPLENPIIQSELDASVTDSTVHDSDQVITPEPLETESTSHYPDYNTPISDNEALVLDTLSTTETVPPIHPTTDSVSPSVLIDDLFEDDIDPQSFRDTLTYPKRIEYPVEDEKQMFEESPMEGWMEPVYRQSKPEPPKEPEVQKTSGLTSNLYTTLTDMLGFTSTDEPEPHSIINPEHVSNSKTLSEETARNSIIDYLLSVYESVMGAKPEYNDHFLYGIEDNFCDGRSNNQNRFSTFLITTACTLLLFILGYYYIDNKRQDNVLIGNINNLQRELLFATKECEILKEELTTTKTKLTGIEDNSFGMDDMVQSLKEEINELKEQNERLRNSLDDNEKLLRVSENTASELQNTLSEVENTLSELLAERTNSEEQITELNEKIRAFEEELISVSRDRDNFQLKFVSAEVAQDDLNKQKSILDELNKKMVEANNTIELQRHEIVALKDTIKEMKNGAPSNVDAKSLIDHTEIKAKLAKTSEEKNSYMNKYEVAQKEQLRLAEELKVTQESYQTSSQQATEAVTRLEVLGKYFQERESELMKELSTKESLWLSKQGESASTVEKMELLQQEIQRYKEKCDTLTLELAEQESGRRAAISELEARAHAAWLDARQARRDADAAGADAAALRRKLVALSHADGATSPHRPVASPLEVDGAPVPPLPLAFLPPPLLPPLPRPPPLGRLPSPPLPRFSERHYSPESRYSPETRYSPESRYSPVSRYSPEPRYSPHSRRSPYSSRSRRRSIDRYSEGRARRNGPDTETEYNSDSPTRRPRRRYARRSGPSSGSGCSSESEK